MAPQIRKPEYQDVNRSVNCRNSCVNRESVVRKKGPLGHFIILTVYDGLRINSYSLRTGLRLDTPVYGFGAPVLYFQTTSRARHEYVHNFDVILQI